MAQAWQKLVTEAKAQWEGEAYSPAIGTNVLTRGWKGLNEGVQADILNGLNLCATGGNGIADAVASRFIVNPSVQKGNKTETRTGTYYVASNRFDPIKYQGIIQELHLAQVVRTDAASNTIADLAALPSVKINSDEILKLFNFQTGTADTLAFTWRSLDPTSEAAVMALTTAALVAVFTPSVLAPAVTTWVCADRKWQTGEDGLATFSVLFRKVAWRAWSDALPADTRAVTFAGSDIEERTRRWYGIANASVETAITYLKTHSGDALFFVESTPPSDNGDGSSDIVQHVVHLPPGAHCFKSYGPMYMVTIYAYVSKVDDDGLPYKAWVVTSSTPYYESWIHTITYVSSEMEADNALYGQHDRSSYRRYSAYWWKVDVVTRDWGNDVSSANMPHATCSSPEE